MPTPNCDSESWDDFRERCMSDDEAQEDFPDQDQRLAFCASQWESECGSNPLDESSVEDELMALELQRLHGVDDD